MAMDSKKRQMTDHLDKTLAQVVDNWKKQEAELKAVTEQLRDEKALLIGQQQKTQAVSSPYSNRNPNSLLLFLILSKVLTPTATTIFTLVPTLNPINRYLVSVM